MPVNLSVKNVPDEIMSRLKARAARNHRSVQGEMMAILERATGMGQGPAPMTMEEAVEQLRALRLSTPAEAADMIREDRDRDGR